MIEQTNRLIHQINDILNRAQDAYLRGLVTRHEYDWMTGKTEDESFASLAQNKHKLCAIEKAKYINIDRIPANATGQVYGSGLFMIDKTSGYIYGIKAYGKVHRGHFYGTVELPNLRELCLKAAVLERGEVAELFNAAA